MPGPRLVEVKMQEFIDMLGGDDGARLAPALAAVHRVSLLDGSAFDPQALLRAVNELQGLGGERAVRVLATYAAASEAAPRRVEGVDLDAVRSVLVMRLLFVPRSPGPPLPIPALGKPDVDLTTDPTVCPDHPLVSSCEIPFLPVGSYHIGGAIESAQRLLTTYRRLGKVRDRRLAPSCAPVEAAERLVRSAAWRRLVPERQAAWARWMLYQQALRAGRPAYPVDDETLTRLAAADPAEQERLWQRIAHDPAARALSWDARAGEFRSP